MAVYSRNRIKGLMLVVISRQTLIFWFSLPMLVVKSKGPSGGDAWQAEGDLALSAHTEHIEERAFLVVVPSRQRQIFHSLCLYRTHRGMGLLVLYFNFI